MTLTPKAKAFFLAALLALAVVFALQPTSNAVPLAFDAAATFTAKCVKCHGADGRGAEKYKKKGVKDFTDAKWQKSRTDAQLIASINNGKGDVMPGWKAKLSAEEIKALVAHVRAFKH